MNQIEQQEEPDLAKVGDLVNTKIMIEANSEVMIIPASNLPIDKLPVLLKMGVQELRSEREQALFITSLLAVLSGVMTRVKGVYSQREYYPNVFFMVLARAASGKGVMMYSKELIQGIHDKLVKESREALINYNKTKPKKNVGPTPTPPPFKVAIIPANCSTSKLMQHLMDNYPYTPQIMIESEMDTLSTAAASEWGNFSDILRKVFQNEPATLSRKGNNCEFLEVTTPKLSVVLSGTMGQIFKLINNNEDGLFSRFLVMTFDGESKWNDVSPCPTCKNLTDFFRTQSGEYLKLWEFLSQQDILVELTPQQWSTLNHYCNTKNRDINEDYGPVASSLIRRHGLMLFKLCMVLTGVRAYEDRITTDTLICRQEDFETALYIVSKSIDSSLDIFNLLPSVKSPNHEDKKDRLFKLLPQNFKRKEAIDIGEKEKMRERTTDRWLQRFIRENRLSQPSMGEYVKV